MAKVIGIDLGTSNSAAAVMEAGRPVIIPSAEGAGVASGKAFPSYGAFTKDGERLVGEPARRQAAINAEGTIQAAKRKMGTDAKVSFFPKKISRRTAYLDALQSVMRPACAIIAVPDHLHGEIADAAIEEGFHTLVVKPLVPTVKEAIALVKSQKKAKVYCAVEFHKRLDRANMKLRDVFESGTIGDPLYFLVEFSQRKSMPTSIFRKWVKTTNVFQYLGIHYVDLVYFVTKATPIRAMGLGQKNWLSAKGIDTYDSVQGVIEWRMPSGKRFTSSISTNWIDPESTSAMSYQSIKAIGTRGRFESDQKNRGIVITTDINGIEEPNPYFCASYGKEGSSRYEGYGIESIRQFLDDVSGIESGSVMINELEGARPTFRQSMTSTRALEAVNESLRNDGRWVNVRI